MENGWQRLFSMPCGRVLVLLVILLPQGWACVAAHGQGEAATPTRRRKVTYGSRELRPLLSRVVTLAEEDKYDEALALETRALSLVSAEPEPDKLSVSILLEEIGFLQYSKGDYAAAEHTYQLAFTALDEWRASLPIIMPTQDQSPLTLDKLSPHKRMYRAMLLLATGRASQTLPLLSGIDRDRERNFVVVADHLSENDKLKHMGNISLELNIIISCLTDPQQTQREEAADLAATAVLRRKARVLDALSQSLSRLRQHLTPDDVRAINEVNEARTMLSQLSTRADLDLAERLAETQRLTRLLRDKVQALDESSSRYHLFWQPITTERVQGAIPVGAALVEFVRHRPFNARATRNADRWGPERYVAFVLRPTGGPAWVDVGDADSVDGQVMRFRAALRRPPDPMTGGRAFADSLAAVKEAARALDAQVMQPVRRFLGSAHHLFVVPDGQLSLIPFSALVSERGDFLLSRYSITYLSSGRDLLRSQENRLRPNSPPAVFAHPAFDGPSAAPADNGGEGCSRVKNRTRASAPRQDTAANGGAAARDFIAPTFDLGTIGNTLSEARDICALLPEARLFTDGRATESALKQMQSPRILHVATHGFIRPDRVRDAVESQTTWLDLAAYDPAFSPAKQEPPVEDVLTRSGLALANANLRQNAGDNVSGQDGVLTALEASGLNLWGTQLVVLSACSTGLGDIRNGEGFFGLRRALFVAGAESQLISLWNVNDAATRRLMVRFYTLLLRRRQGRLESLQSAQLDMASGIGAWAHPYYWAGFVMSGEWLGLEASGATSRPRRGR